ncbi:MAG: tetratricopeptide repeat protein [Candidatus Schekmanbacteria bacterium]|nr:tetratricopeptide repeat protein [Candidatus Schekmanbacteria bacterium]
MYTWHAAVAVLLTSLLAGAVLVVRERRRRGATEEVAEAVELQDLRARRACLLEELRVLDLDEGRLSPTAFKAERQRLLEDAAEVFRQLEKLEAVAGKQRHTRPGEQARPARLLRWLPAATWAGAAAGFALLLTAVIQEALAPQPPAQAPHEAAMPAPIGAAPGAEETLPELPETIAELNGVAHRALAEQDYNTAMAAAQKALGMDPKDLEARAHMAFMRAVIGRTDKALQSLDEILADAPDHHESLIFKTLIALQAGDADLAEATAKHAMTKAVGAQDREVLTSLLEQAKALRAGGERVGQAAPAPGAGGGTGSPATAGAAPGVSGTIRLADGAAGEVSPQDTVYVIARATESTGGPPAAVRRLAAGEFPMPFALGTEDIMAGAAWPDRMTITVRIDKDGDAMTRSEADLEGSTPAPVALGARDVEIVVGS